MSGLLAGALIGLGGYAYLSIGGELGAVLFAIGLLSVVVFQLPLYTGKVCSLPDVLRPDKMIILYLLNIIGAALFGIVTATRTDVVESAINLVSMKADKSLWVAFVDGIVCGMCVAIAVKSKNIVIIIMTVALFILCGGEHCIADVYYMTVARKYDIPLILIVTLGNTLGGGIMMYVKGR